MSSGRSVGWTSGVRYLKATLAFFQRRRAERAAEDLSKLEAAFPASSLTDENERTCGSPARDAYVEAGSAEGVSCLERSPTAILYKKARLEAASADGGGDGDDGLDIVLLENVSLDGLAVAWGPSNKKESVLDCARACVKHQVPSGHGIYRNLPCNAFAFCPDPECFEPDAHQHTMGDCWLKFTELPHVPELNQVGAMSEQYRARHANAPEVTQWTSGVVLLPQMSQNFTGGVWGPRAEW